ncbi:MAG: polyprenyl diphosphate synthase [Christensenellales bacterium]
MELREIIRASDDWGVKYLTIYAFSTENWSRSKEEVGALMGLLLKYFASEIDELDEKHVRIRILGDVEGLPEAQRDAVKSAMERTKANEGLQLNIALNYGGRAELLRAARALAEQVRSGALDPADIDEAKFDAELYTAGQPPVDLLIRTSGGSACPPPAVADGLRRDGVRQDLLAGFRPRGLSARLREFAGRSRPSAG